jgi:hypothetical protein
MLAAQKPRERARGQPARDGVRGDAPAPAPRALSLRPALARTLHAAHRARVRLVPEHVVLGVRRAVVVLAGQRAGLRRRREDDEALGGLARALRLRGAAERGAANGGGAAGKAGHAFGREGFAVPARGGRARWWLRHGECPEDDGKREGDGWK